MNGDGRETSRAALAANVCGVLAFCGGFGFSFSIVGLLLGLPAIILGYVARARVRQNPELGGNWLAFTGLILGYLSLSIGLAIIMLILLAFTYPHPWWMEHH